jgi:hypothetical protein
MGSDESSLDKDINDIDDILVVVGKESECQEVKDVL